MHIHLLNIIYLKYLRPLLLFFICFIIINESVSQDNAFKQDIRLLLSLLLENGYQVKLAEQDNLLYQGQLKSFQGKFDYHLGLHGGGLSSNMTLSPENVELYGVTKLTTREYYYGAGLSKQFDFGLSFEPRITYSQTEYKIPGIKPFNQASAQLIFNLPLLKGLGKNVDVANVENANSNYQAALDNYHHIISIEFFDCLSAYINYIVAVEIYDAFEIKISRADSLLAATKLLVEKDELPASEITTVEAYKGDANLKLLTAGLEVNDQKARIGKISGIGLSDFTDLHLNSRKLSAITFLFNPDSNFITKSIEIALKNRKDIMALDKVQTGSTTMLEALEKNKLPELNLELDVGYSGYDEGARFNNFYSPFYNNVGGANIQATLRYKIPFANSKAKGDFLSQKASLEQINLQKNQLKKTTAIEISTIVKNLKTLTTEYQKAGNTVAMYKKVLEDQLIKLKMEESTLIEYFTVEDKLMEVVINKLHIETKMLKEILWYKFATGLLIEKQDGHYSVDIDKLFTITE